MSLPSHFIGKVLAVILFGRRPELILSKCLDAFRSSTHAALLLSSQNIYPLSIWKTQKTAPLFYFHLSSHPPPFFLIAQPSGHAPPNQPIRKQCALQAHTSLDWLISIDVLVAYTHRLQVTQIHTRARVACVFTLRSKHTKKYRLRECLKSSAFNPSTLVSPPFCLTCVL